MSNDLTHCFLEAKGTGANLFKPGSKRRRTKVELDEQREEQRLRQEAQDRQAH